MRRRLTALAVLGAVASASLLWLVATPMVSAGDPCFHGFEMPASTVGTTDEIELMPCAFAPTVANVATGSTVRFVNGPNLAHLVTGANQEWGSRETQIAPGTTVSYTFDKAGLYPYACALHPGMSGVIVVGDAAASGAAAAPGGAATGAGAAQEGTSAGETVGGSTEARTDSAITAAAAGTSTQTVSSDAVPIIAMAAFIGAVIGGLGAWMFARRRSARADSAIARVA